MCRISKYDRIENEHIRKTQKITLFDYVSKELLPNAKSVLKLMVLFSRIILVSRNYCQMPKSVLKYCMVLFSRIILESLTGCRNRVEERNISQCFE